MHEKSITRRYRISDSGSRPITFMSRLFKEKQFHKKNLNNKKIRLKTKQATGRDGVRQCYFPNARSTLIFVLKS